MTNRMNDNAEWLLQMAAAEDNCDLAVGGLAHELGLLQTPTVPATRAAFAKLIELRRRDRNLTVEQLAQQADIELAELLSIERGEEAAFEPRTIYKLATELKLPPQKMMQLAGIADAKDPSVTDAAVRFAARSKPMDHLTHEEQEALKEFVKILAEG